MVHKIVPAISIFGIIIYYYKKILFLIMIRYYLQNFPIDSYYKINPMQVNININKFQF